MLRHTFFALSMLCLGSLDAMAQDASGTRTSDRALEQRSRPLTGENPSTSSPQTPPAAPAVSQAAPTIGGENFIIGAADVLSITVWREPDLTTGAVVRPDGKIGLPLLSDVQASGLTTKQLQDRITEGLSAFLEDPVVSVVVAEIHSQMVHIMGAIGRSGSYALGGPLTIVELLSRAGGLAEFSKRDEIVIVRSERGRARRFIFNYDSFVEGKNLQQNIPLLNGDIVLIP